MIPARLFTLFGLDPSAEVSKFGEGLINDTFLYVSDDIKLVIQRLNHHVFKDIKSLMENVSRVEHHIRLHHPQVEFLSFRQTTTGGNVAEIDGSSWRIMNYIKNSHSYDRLLQHDQAIEAGRLIGLFHSQLAGMDPGLLVDTIPDFHNFSARYQKFLAVADGDLYDRLRDCKEEVFFLKNRGEEILALQKNLNLPIRVVHNDTKLNNMLFDDKEQGICMVDLDTIMAGEITFDTGDLLRTMCNGSGEDGTLGPVEFDIQIYQNFLLGYLPVTQHTITSRELMAIPDSIDRMATEQAIRFLTDYLQGDIYFKQAYKGFNLVCVQTQIAFITILNEYLPVLREEIKNKVAGD